ncbi:MAG: sigma-70 family RNA polymerase sigma factor [Rubricoccaceae bacterium]|nr:sigma-70 family RNA polymerase sigma factor [Rubricoccaceae bacterium]
METSPREAPSPRPPRPLSGEPDGSLCRRLRASDREAFAEVFRRHRDGLLRYVHTFVHDDAQTHDLVQDVFEGLWALRDRLDPAQSLPALLFRMARNRSLRHLRDARLHARKHTEMDPPPPPPLPGNALDADTLAHRFSAWIADLPPQQREALTLSRFHALSHREVAETMGISPRTVNNHIVRALKRLKRHLDAFDNPHTPT